MNAPRVAALVGVLACSAADGRADEIRPGVFRTPASRFADLPDYPFAPHYLEFRGYRLHFVDEGPREGLPILLMHGEPSWSYLYRRMIPALVEAGYRVIAPDLIGFGKSDKPARRNDHSYPFHVDAMQHVLRTLDLQRTTLFCQDWGGLIGLRLVVASPERFDHVVASNTALPDGPGEDGIVRGTEYAVAAPGTVVPIGLSEGFAAWLRYSQTTPDFDAGAVVEAGTVRTLTDREIAAYRAPFPDERYMAGARALPTLVGSQQATNRKAWAALAAFNKPFLTLFGDDDHVTGQNYRRFQERVPGAKGQPHAMLERAGHFLQEDVPDELTRRVLAFIAGRERP